MRPSTNRKRTCIQWSDEGLAGGRLRLRDLIFVVREGQVLAARVQVEALAKVLHRHGRTLDVPTGPARAERRVPEMLIRLGRLPKREVAGRILVILVEIDARPVGDAGKVLLRELAVFGKAGDAEVPGAILRAIGQILGCQPFDELLPSPEYFPSRGR